MRHAHFSRVRPSAAVVVSLIALVLALSGSALAAGSLRGGDKVIAKHSLSANRLRDHTLSGKQIDVSRLGTVPSARTAGSAATATHAADATRAVTATSAKSATTAATVAGQTIKHFSRIIPVNADPVAVLSSNGLTLEAGCPSGQPEVRARSAVQGAWLRATTIGQGSTPARVVGASHTIAGLPVTIFSPADARGTIDLHYLQPDGHHVDIDAGVESLIAINGSSGCLLEGQAIAG
jgi:hypothetical protein